MKAAHLISLVDAVGEITNMMADKAITGFPRSVDAMTVPRVVFGRKRVPDPAATTVVQIPVQAPMDPLDIAVAQKKSS